MYQPCLAFRIQNGEAPVLNIRITFIYPLTPHASQPQVWNTPKIVGRDESDQKSAQLSNNVGPASRLQVLVYRWLISNCFLTGDFGG